MNEIALLRALASKAESPEAAARAAALQALEASFERAEPTSAASTRRGFFSRRGRLLAFSGATAIAAIVAGILILSSGPAAQPAAAEVLRHTAAIAAAGTNSGSTPGPGQFLYTETKSLELQGWAPGSYTVGGVTLSQKGAFNALVPSREEVWSSTNEVSRHRSILGTPQFLSSAEQSRWEQAGAPLPGPFDPSAQHNPNALGEHVIELRRGVVDVEGKDGAGFIDASALPTEPKALRLAIEHRQASGTSSSDEPAAEPLDTPRVIAELWEILDKPNTTPALRAAVFGALAELPGIELDRNAEDLAGHPGYALSYEGPQSGGYGASQMPGIRVEYIFDPKTSAILDRREVIIDPEKFSWAKEIPTGTVRREVAYLESGIVDSTHERPGERNGEPVATIGPIYRR